MPAPRSPNPSSTQSATTYSGAKIAKQVLMASKKVSTSIQNGTKTTRRPSPSTLLLNPPLSTKIHCAGPLNHLPKFSESSFRVLRHAKIVLRISSPTSKPFGIKSTRLSSSSKATMLNTENVRIQSETTFWGASRRQKSKLYKAVLQLFHRITI